MTLAEVSNAELELGGMDLGPAERRGFEVSGDRSTANWS